VAVGFADCAAVLGPVARSADRHSMSQHRLPAWRGRTRRPEDMDSRLRGNDGAWGRE
jgi:hypothetical protein